MRDVGILIWVGLLIVGVVGSMISSLRRQTQAPALRQAPRRPQAPPVQEQEVPSIPTWIDRVSLAPAAPVIPQPVPQPAPPVPKPRAVAPAPPRAVTQHPPSRPVHVARRRLLGTKRDIVRAVIALEVLGKPRAFRDE